MKKSIASATLGRNMLNVAKFKMFLDESKDRPFYKALLELYERYMKGSLSVEVTATDVYEKSGNVECTLRARGILTDTFFVPPDCLTAIKPVVAKATAPVNLFRELDRLAYA